MSFIKEKRTAVFSYVIISATVTLRFNLKSLQGPQDSRHSQELDLNDAVLDLDSLKRNQIQNQSKILAVQEELISKISEHHEEVKSTVDEKRKN